MNYTGIVNESGKFDDLTPLEKEESECDKVLREIHLEWGENWDLVIDFFGQELADKIDKAIGYEQ